MSKQKEKSEKQIPDRIRDLLDRTSKIGEDMPVYYGDMARPNVDAIPTDIPSLDAILGPCGVPIGRMIEIYGPESSGKTTTALQMAAATQKRGGLVCYIDAEHALDPEWATNIGVNVKEMALSQPDSAENAIKIAEACIDSKIDLVIIDSVAALVPQKELEGDIEDSNVGLQARLMSKACRVLTGKMNKSKTTLVWINQIREKIGITFGSNETTPGGRALKFWSAVRLDIRKVSSIKQGETIIGNTVKIKVVKNKVGPPLKICEFNICFGHPTQTPRPVYGVDKIASLLGVASAIKVVTKNGNFMKYGDSKLGNGENQAINTLLSDQELYNKLHAEVYGAMTKDSGTNILEMTDEELIEFSTESEGEE